ncbi:hypothetical protein CYJ40_00725 [Brevibacterium ravenspurgense]|uniref:Quercetin 2,3-dioxygenase n=1 Tax=Brevibacterium ravenspurgense TaxID=479117 RepID=A0A2I1IJE5_9MICO|nr:pirin-like C-terminal cupin domain-containing protein [Brevibacterium ravenspurgense]PKY71234.1 hypothetical protein CYJ40_00725 [Brevibacterium ravenspurgense]
MSNLEKRPRVHVCTAADATELTVVEPRDIRSVDTHGVPLRRALPHDELGMIGPWCYLDHFGPQGVDDETGKLTSPTHPHAGVACMPMLFSGSLTETFSTGTSVTVEPGEASLIIAGRGASHSEFTTEDTEILHGVELWYALPDKHRFAPASTQHYPAECFYAGDCKVTVYVGSVGEVRSPIDPVVSVVAAQLDIYGTAEIPLSEHFEHGLLVDSGEAQLTLADGTTAVIEAEQLAFIPQGNSTVRLSADVPTRLVLFGGQPFDEEIVMWWNFAGRSHEEIEQWYAQYRSEIEVDEEQDDEERTVVFGPLPENPTDTLSLPTLPDED